jgi:hypothetical protein
MCKSNPVVLVTAAEISEGDLFRKKSSNSPCAVLIYLFEGLAEAVGCYNNIRVDKGNHVSPCYLCPFVSRIGHSVVSCVLHEATVIPFGDSGGVVRGGIIHYDDLEVGITYIS